jgi:nicotinamidase-related amidase
MSCSSSTTGRLPRDGPDPMRLPGDAVLLVIDAQQAGPRHGADGAQEVETNIAALLAAWRVEGLPLAHVGRPPSDLTPSLAPTVSPLDGEIVIIRNATSGFVGADLEARLDELGATTLVLCGALGTHALEASARHAADLGYQVFVVADACLAADVVDLSGRLWPAQDVRALAMAHLKGETATIVDAATTLRAAAMAKARQRRAAGRA